MSGCPSFLTQAVYQSLAPSASGIYTYASFCAAIESWNTNTANTKIFSGATDLDKKNEVAAFLGHVLHESGDLVYPREISQCATINSGYCQSTNTGGYSAYCSTVHTTTSSPDGCNCGTVVYSSSSGGYEANKMFFGRGPVSYIVVVYCMNDRVLIRVRLTGRLLFYATRFFRRRGFTCFRSSSVGIIITSMLAQR
jgi:hypothetical protein